MGIAHIEALLLEESHCIQFSAVIHFAKTFTSHCKSSKMTMIYRCYYQDLIISKLVCTFLFNNFKLNNLIKAIN